MVNFVVLTIDKSAMRTHNKKELLQDYLLQFSSRVDAVIRIGFKRIVLSYRRLDVQWPPIKGGTLLLLFCLYYHFK